MSSQRSTQQRARLTGPRHQVSLPYSNTASPSSLFPTCPGSLIPIDSRSECSLTAENHAYRWAGENFTIRHRLHVTSIDVLPDDVLLEIFDFYEDNVEDEDEFTKTEIEAWQSLVHVCRRWRNVVFGSPGRLNLRLVCTKKTPARNMLDVWPAVPLIIEESGFLTEGVDNIIAVLERRDRVVKIDLFDVDSLDLETVLAAMQDPFPGLTYLRLRSESHDGMSALSDSFLGGHAPRLRFLSLCRIPFSGLSKLLLSSTHLVTLHLSELPHSGYISPNVMASALSTLTSLEDLWLKFESPRSLPDWASRRPPPPSRSALPVLTCFTFKGVSEYLDDFMTRIDAPRLDDLNITFFNQIVFNTPQFIQFISRTPTLKAFKKALVIFDYDATSVHLLSQTPGGGNLEMKIPCIDLDWQVSSMEQVCSSCLPPLSTLEDLYIYEPPYLQLDWQDGVENPLWLEFLHPFIAVKNLYLSEEYARRIGPALQELVGSRATEVLPALQNMFLEGLQPSRPVQNDIRQFVATRQVTNSPVTVYRWDRDRSRGSF